LAKAQIALALCGWIWAFAKPVLYEVPTYLAQNLNWNTKQKNKKKKSVGNFKNKQYGKEFY
jgi:hypothetical protein